MKYLLDTNILSEPIKTTPHAGVLKNLELYQNEIATAAPVWHELLFGCYRLPPSPKKQIIQTYLENVIYPTIPIIPYDNQAAGYHAKERARLTTIGKTPSFTDGQIAAIAHTHNLVLVTRNIKDFSPFSNLTIEDWHSSSTFSDNREAR